MDASQQTLRENAAEMEQRARALIEAHYHFIGRSKKFEFKYTNNMLIVRGSVPTFYLKQIVQSALKELEDVCLVDNQIRVASMEGLTERLQS